MSHGDPPDLLPSGGALAHPGRASYYSHLVDSARMLTAVDITDTRTGTLLLIDLATGTEHHVDDDVFLSEMPAPDPDGYWTYAIPEGERAGVWRVRFPGL